MWNRAFHIGLVSINSKYAVWLQVHRMSLCGTGTGTHELMRDWNCQATSSVQFRPLDYTIPHKRLMSLCGNSPA